MEKPTKIVTRVQQGYPIEISVFKDEHGYFATWSCYDFENCSGASNTHHDSEGQAIEYALINAYGGIARHL